MSEITAEPEAPGPNPSPGEPDFIQEVHNVWAVYENPEGDTPLAEHARPQDWGDPRWHYEKFRLEWQHTTADGEVARYINHAHCWTEIRLELYQYPEHFASLIVQIMYPGSHPKLCGREYLEENDFWEEEWGKQPPYFDEESTELSAF
jgi:hypothetical protein